MAALGLLAGLLAGCLQSAPEAAAPWDPYAQTPALVAGTVVATRTPFLPATRAPGTPILTPTPDVPHQAPGTANGGPQQYVVQPGDTLGLIAQRFGVTLAALIQANELVNPDILEVGQVITIPAAEAAAAGADFKIIPDSELVLGPASIVFEIEPFLRARDSYLLHYREEVDGHDLRGDEIVLRAAQQNSVNPRLLLAVLEYQSGWVLRANPNSATRTYPMGHVSTWHVGLYRQLSWAANELNRGYYTWRVSGVRAWGLVDGTLVQPAATINAGTAGVQNLFAQLLGQAAWEQAVSPQGVFATYQQLFGYPFDVAIEPLLPADLAQPVFQLPFEVGDVWSFTGGPHGGWADGAAWAALDFAPPGESQGCLVHTAWVTAIADGLIVRSRDGEVVQDLDGDGFEQTGWTVLYMHISATERVAVGAYLRAGERIGHPSCEGGYSTATHLHLARRFNGEWIPADQDLPFVLDGWVSSSAGVEYDGYLTKNGKQVEAWEGNVPESKIQR